MTDAAVILAAMESAYKRGDIATVKALANEFVLVLAQMNPNDALAFLAEAGKRVGMDIPPTLTRWRTGVLRPNA